MSVPKTCPRIWHCVFCGRHGPITDFQISTGDTPIQGCPVCREYKGVELCDPNTCDCWQMDVVRKLAEREGRLHDPNKYDYLKEE